MSASPSPAPHSQKHEADIAREKKYRKEILKEPLSEYVKWLDALEKLPPPLNNGAEAAVEKFLFGKTEFGDAYIKWGKALEQQGAALQRQGKLSEAKEKYKKAVERYQRAAELGTQAQSNGHGSDLVLKALLSAGALLNKQHEDESALVKYEQAIKIAPQNGSAYRRYGRTLLALKSYPRAEQAYRHAIAIDPTERCFRDWINALDHLQPEERDKAVAELTKQLERQSQPAASAWEAWGRALKQRGRFEEAIDRFETALQLGYGSAAKGCGEAYLRWGQSLVERHKFEAAIDKYQRAPAFDATLTEAAYLGWAKVLELQDEYWAAMDKYAHIVRLLPQAAQPCQRWGNLLYSHKRYTEAEEKYRKALEIQPEGGNFRRWLHCMALLDPKEQEGKAEHVEAVLAELAEPQRAAAYQAWGDELKELERYADAAGKYQSAIDLQPEDYNLQVLLGNTLCADKQHDAALAAYEKSKNLGDPEHDVDYRIGLVFQAQRQPDRAIRQYAKALSHASNDEIAGDISNSYGSVLYARGEFLDAEGKFRTAIERNPNQGGYFEHWWDAVLRLDPEQQNQACIKMATLAKSGAGPNRDEGSFYLNWANGLVSLGRYAEAFMVFPKAAEESGDAAGVIFSWACALADKRRYEEALQKFHAVAPSYESPYYVYCCHNIAHYLGKQGKYQESFDAWKTACAAYERTRLYAIDNLDPDCFFYYAGVLVEVFRDLRFAEEICLEGLSISPNSAVLMTQLGEIYLEQEDEGLLDSATARANAQECFRKAARVLRERIDKEETAELCLRLGELLLQQLEKPAEARVYLEKALQIDPDSAPVHTELGVFFARQSDFKQAALHFQHALKLDPDDLNVWSNLAEAYLKSDSEKWDSDKLKSRTLETEDKAEQEFKKILAITGGHIDSHIGLGQLYARYGDRGDIDSYDHAIRHFEKAISLARSERRSKCMKRRELATVYYALGYTQVRLFNKSKPFGDEALLTSALDNFRECVRLDTNNYKAMRAIAKLERHGKLLSPQSRIEKFGPWFMLAAFAFVFIITQVAFWFHPKALELKDTKLYTEITMGSVLFSMLGVYLPRILKIKVAGVELEKSGVDQFRTTSQPIEISS